MSTLLCTRLRTPNFEANYSNINRFGPMGKTEDVESIKKMLTGFHIGLSAF